MLLRNAAFAPMRPTLAALAGALIAGCMLSAAARADTPSVDAIVGALVRVYAEVPGDARTAESLGTEREGNGVVIDSNGLVLTVGYLILEADQVFVGGPDGHRLPAEAVAYDHGTGFGLLRALSPLKAPPLRLGDSDSLQAETVVLVGRAGGPELLQPAKVVSRRVFAGYWEYLLEDAIFTVPPMHDWGGAALIGPDGRLLGIGSLLVNDAMVEPETQPGNMFIPINSLKPVLGDMLTAGRSLDPARPWLGIYGQEMNHRLLVSRVASGGPAERAGVRPGDLILGVGGEPISDLADFYRKVWSLGPAGVQVPLTVLQGDATQTINVESSDRYHWLKLNRSY